MPLLIQLNTDANRVNFTKVARTKQIKAYKVKHNTPYL